MTYERILFSFSRTCTTHKKLGEVPLGTRPSFSPRSQPLQVGTTIGPFSFIFPICFSFKCFSSYYNSYRKGVHLANLMYIIWYYNANNCLGLPFTCISKVVINDIACINGIQIDPDAIPCFLISSELAICQEAHLFKLSLS